MKALGLPVFWGGHMASAIPEEAARCGCVDYVGISEGEYTLLELLEVIQGRRAPESVLGIAYVDENGAYHRTGDRPFADLADFPPLDYSLVPVERFLFRLQFSDNVFMMVTSKGCVHNCTFCSNKEYNRCQRRDIPNEVLFKQMKDLAENLGVKGLMFFDEFFGADKRKLRTFCEGLKELNLGLTWWAETTVSAMTREDLQMMHDAGCRALAFGLESGSAEVRKAVRKHYDASKVDEVLRDCREIGILVAVGLILALPDETPEQVRETVRLYFRTQPDIVRLPYFSPIPGTQLYRSLVEAGRLRAPKTLEDMGTQILGWDSLTVNFSRVPDKDLRVIKKYMHWQMVFGKKRKIPQAKRSRSLKMAFDNLRIYLRCAGLRGLARGLWDAAKFVCGVAWYANAYPSIRKKYDLYAKNLGRTDWGDQ